MLTVRLRTWDQRDLRDMAQAAREGLLVRPKGAKRFNDRVLIDVMAQLQRAGPPRTDTRRPYVPWP